MNPIMFYFGPWERAGHFMHGEDGHEVWNRSELSGFPWQVDGSNIDGVLQPTCYQDPEGRWRNTKEPLNEAVLHQKNGWTAISFWDRSVDTRGACNSTYFAKGIYTFDEMVNLAKERFKVRWDKHGDIKQYMPNDGRAVVI